MRDLLRNASALFAFTALGAAFAAPSACSHDESAGPHEGSATPASEHGQASNALAAASAASAASPSHETNSPVDDNPREKFSDPERTFQTAKDTLLSSYYADSLSQEDLYRAALRGMLEYADPKMKSWNKLLSPWELAEMRSSLKGEVVGVGVQIRFEDDSGYADVLGTIPGSAAEKAGLVTGDKIVSVDGKLYKGKQLRDVVADIRGKVGETVTLSILRGDKILSVPLVRGMVAFDPVKSMTLPDGYGYIGVRTFSSKTAPLARTALDGMRGIHGLIVDLRACLGGSFDDAVATAELLLPNGTVIVKTVGRSGKEDTKTSHGPGLFAGLPTVVLVDHDTSSGCEFVTAALREGRHARVVGARTFGKWSVQQLFDLPNGYAMKYTVSLFYTPAGKTYDGVGLSPDVDVTMDEKQRDKADSVTVPEARLDVDPPLRTALALLRGR
jgi:carboxyl-terminal processing protease